MQNLDFKVIIIKETTNQFEELLKKGWRVSASYPHPKGVVIVLGKQKGGK